MNSGQVRLGYNGYLVTPRDQANVGIGPAVLVPLFFIGKILGWEVQCSTDTLKVSTIFVYLKQN